MRLLYSVKGCSHCDKRTVCTKEQKNDPSNLQLRTRRFREIPKKFESHCMEFTRSGAVEF